MLMMNLESRIIVFEDIGRYIHYPLSYFLNNPLFPTDPVSLLFGFLIMKQQRKITTKALKVVPR